LFHYYIFIYLYLIAHFLLLVLVYCTYKVLNGSGATIFRNSGLFGSFMLYIDLSKQIIPGT